jgi:hypothetical protein
MPKVSEMLRNTPKHHWVQWTRMYDSELWHPEIVHSGPKDEFFIFYVPKVSEMLETLPNIIFGSNGLEWMFHTFGTPKLCI